MARTKISLLLALLSCVISSTSLAAGNRTDYDLDDDGLIEINDWADLDDLRTSYGNGTLYGSSLGCPAAGCAGYELTTDLNFDTDGNGKLDAKDTYWNNGEGWNPIQSAPNVFEGNGHAIRNLMINRPYDIHTGLFEHGRGDIRNLGMVNVDITGYSRVGALAGDLHTGSIIGCFVTGKLKATDYIVGGLVGENGTNIKAAFSTATVESPGFAGGILGYSGALIESSFSAASIIFTASSYYSGANAHGSNSYWASDLYVRKKKPSSSDGYMELNDASLIPATLAQLKCPVAANDTSCLPGTILYAGWDQVKDAQGNAYWDFGTKYELPGLVLSGVLYRDGDGNGVLDNDDEPLDTFCMSLDKDSDDVLDSFSSRCVESYPDAIDQFPSNTAVSVDDDHDGLADVWNPACDTACQNASGLALDKSLKDTDNDGVQDRGYIGASGVFDRDENNNGLVEIWSLADLNNIRSSSAAYISLTSEGCPKVAGDANKRLCNGYELMVDLDFDTNGDGKLDEYDTYWNGGLGWEPLNISGNFEGNGHVIRNLMVNRPTSAVGGLFGFVNDLHIRNLGLTGPLMSVTANVYVGGLVGLMDGGSITGCFTTGRITALGDYAGGLVGSAHGTKLAAVFSTAVLDAKLKSGGLIGNAGWDEGTTISHSFAAAKPYSSNAFNGLSQGGVAISSYWANDAKLNGSSIDNDFQTNGRPASLVALKCADASNTKCLPGTTLYADWSNALDLKGNRYWDFGDSTQLPGLVLNGHLYRDGDGDGVLDTEDAFPNDYCRSVDADKDGVADAVNAHCGELYAYNNSIPLDKFLNNHAASIDQDGDGLPDAWTLGCDEQCQAGSGLTLDKFPSDFDNNGTPDLPYADSDHDGLIEISSLAQLSAIRNFPYTFGQNLSASGCPQVTQSGYTQVRCRGFELMADLDFDTNGDGKLNEQDVYWNGGSGWEPLIFVPTFFGESVIFEGNGHVIRNLMVNRPSDSVAGLFGFVAHAHIRNLGLTGKLTSITGSGFVGALVGYMENSTITGCFTTGHVKGSFAGGVVGSASGTLTAVFSSAIVDGISYSGGLVGRAFESQISASYAVGSYTQIVAASYGGVGGSSFSGDGNTYWAIDAKADAGSIYDNGGAAKPATLAQLKCPTAADNTTCLLGTKLYAGWAQVTDSNGNAYWDFGTFQQLPGLVLNGVLYRDSDGNGVLDSDEQTSVSSSSSSQATSSSSVASSSLSSVASSSASSVSSLASSSASSKSSSSVIAIASSAAAAELPSNKNKSSGGGVDAWLLLMLCSLGFAWRSKNSAHVK